MEKMSRVKERSGMRGPQDSNGNERSIPVTSLVSRFSHVILTTPIPLLLCSSVLRPFVTRSGMGNEW